MKYKLFTILLMLCILVPMPYAMEKGLFQPPSLEGYTLSEEKMLDKDKIKDGVKETKLEIYVNAAGQKIGKYSTNGKTWEWAIKSVQDVNDNTHNYAIRDSNCDGQFDERYAFTGEEVYLPDCLKDKGKK